MDNSVNSYRFYRTLILLWYIEENECAVVSEELFLQ